MRTRKYELLMPEEIAEERRNYPVIYLPVGPLEWHSYALPTGSDTITAYEVCIRAAEKTGGLVLPAVHCTPYLVRKDIEKYGVDPYGSCIKTFFFKEEVFTALIRDYLRILAEQEYQVIALVSGHGARGFTDVIEGLCKEANKKYRVQAFMTHAWAEVPLEPYTVGHATLMETAAMLYLSNDIDLSKLPQAGTPISCAEYGIIDPNKTAEGFVGSINDPRKATYTIGEKLINAGIANLINKVQNSINLK